VTKTAIFENSRRWTAAILKIVLSPYLCRESSDFDQIWYTDANFVSEDGHLTKIELLQVQDGGRLPYWKFNFLLLYDGAISADLCKIWKADVESHANTGHVTKTAFFEYSKCRKAAILKIVLSSYLRRQSLDFNQIWYADTNFHSKKG